MKEVRPQINNPGHRRHHLSTNEVIPGGEAEWREEIVWVATKVSDVR
jgi:hypothetical protein